MESRPFFVLPAPFLCAASMVSGAGLRGNETLALPPPLRMLCSPLNAEEEEDPDTSDSPLKGATRLNPTEAAAMFPDLGNSARPENGDESAIRHRKV